MQKDRELLYYAAKAAGVRIEQEEDGPPFFYNELNEVWDPINDNSDALRLALKLGFEPLDEPTRRAIVQAAAKIGRSPT